MDCIDGLGECPDVTAQGHGSIKDTRAVKMHRHSGRIGQVSNRAKILGRQDRPSATIMRVLQTDQTRRGVVHISGIDSPFHIRQGEFPETACGHSVKGQPTQG